MRRRSYLIAVGAAVLGGCTEGEDEGDTPGDQATDEPTDAAASAGTTVADETETTTGDTSTDAESSQTDTTETAEETASESETGGSASGDAALTDQEFEVQEREFGTDHGVRAFVENTGEGRLSYVQLDAKFYDGEETLLESALTNIGWLDGGETWEAWIGYPGSGGDDGVEAGEVAIAETSSHAMESLDDVEIGDHAIEEGEFDVSVVGHAENTGDETLDYVEAHVKFYNEDGNVTRTSMTNVQNLDAGETWEFDVSYANTDPTASDTPADYDVLITS